MHNKPIALIILDGLSMPEQHTGDAAAAIKMPHVARWLKTVPCVSLAASGSAVGISDECEGNSELGYYTIGAGRIIAQQSALIDEIVPAYNTLKEALCAADRTVFSIAQTERYIHVTYFFNGAKDNVLSCEVRHLIPSLPAEDYLKYPTLKTVEITDTVLRSLDKDPKDFYLINYVISDGATAQVLEIIDREVARLHEVFVQEMDGTLFITGVMTPVHKTKTVPFMVITKKPLSQDMVAQMRGLADIAPLILRYMDIPVPAEMTGSQKKQ